MFNKSLKMSILQNNSILKTCEESNLLYLAYALSECDTNTVVNENKKHFYNLITSQKPKTRVKLLCNWCSSEDLAKTWNKMSKGNFTWNNIQLVWQDPVDYYVVINRSLIQDVATSSLPLDKTIVFHMEPNLSNEDMWGKEWAVSFLLENEKKFFKICPHEKHGEYNNNEWHLSLSYSELRQGFVTKDQDLSTCLSTVLSGKYRDPGQIKRIDFVKYLEKRGKLDVHVFGNNRFHYKTFKGDLPYHAKDKAILPYKYTFNAENHEKRNYYTEKLIDGILGECLVFYWGCPNVKDFIDPRAYVQLHLSNFEQDCEIVEKAIRENWHEQRLPFIKEAKRKILEELQFFPRLEKILNGTADPQNMKI
jgi:hypothetical protein